MLGDESAVPKSGVRLRINRDTQAWSSLHVFPLEVVSPDGVARLELGPGGIVTKPGFGKAHPDAKLMAI